MSRSLHTAKYIRPQPADFEVLTLLPLTFERNSGLRTEVGVQCSLTRCQSLKGRVLSSLIVETEIRDFIVAVSAVKRGNLIAC